MDLAMERKNIHPNLTSTLEALCPWFLRRAMPCHSLLGYWPFRSAPPPPSPPPLLDPPSVLVVSTSHERPVRGLIQYGRAAGSAGVDRGVLLGWGLMLAGDGSVAVAAFSWPRERKAGGGESQRKPQGQSRRGIAPSSSGRAARATPKTTPPRAFAPNGDTGLAVAQSRSATLGPAVHMYVQTYVRNADGVQLEGRTVRAPCRSWRPPLVACWPWPWSLSQAGVLCAGVRAAAGWHQSQQISFESCQTEQTAGRCSAHSHPAIRRRPSRAGRCLHRVRTYRSIYQHFRLWFPRWSGLQARPGQPAANHSLPRRRLAPLPPPTSYVLPTASRARRGRTLAVRFRGPNRNGGGGGGAECCRSRILLLCNQAKCPRFLPGQGCARRTER
jgi:hypothetical protein